MIYILGQEHASQEDTPNGRINLCCTPISALMSPCPSDIALLKGGSEAIT